ncbi:MAG: ABC transporter ATP-binding protein, partial [Acidimicrobiia bacterium]|nr:ABC transporter ATP-binding protein [Acidimicrobiia bacterium]
NTLSLDAALVAANPGLANFIGKDIVVGVRPEDLSDAELSTSPVDPGRTLTSVTTLMEALGSEIIVHFPLDAEPFAIMDAEFEGEDAVEQTKDDQGRTIYVGRFSPRSRARMGAPLTINVDTSRVHFFDPTTGHAIRG